MPDIDMHKQPKLTIAIGSVGLILPKGRLQFPNLFKARAMKGDSEEKAKFSTAFIMEADVDLKPAVAAVNYAITEKWGAAHVGSNKVKKPFIKHADKSDDADLTTRFPFLIRCNTGQRPGVVFGSMDECKTEEEVYSGRWARISVRAWAWDHPTGGKGVSFNLNNVMLLEHDTKLGFSRVAAETEFSQYFQPVAAGSPDPGSNGKTSVKAFSTDDIFS